MEAQPPEAMKRAMKLADIVGYLYDKGFKSEQQVIAICTKWRTHVPFLNQIDPERLPDRIRMRLAQLGGA
jgi:hypothetical protein